MRTSYTYIHIIMNIRCPCHLAYSTLPLPLVQQRRCAHTHLRTYVHPHVLHIRVHTHVRNGEVMMMCAMMMMFFTLQQQSESKQTVSDQPMPWAARGVSHTSRAKEPVPWAAVPLANQQGERAGAMGGRSIPTHPRQHTDDLREAALTMLFFESLLRRAACSLARSRSSAASTAATCHDNTTQQQRAGRGIGIVTGGQ